MVQGETFTRITVSLGWVHWHNQDRLRGFIGDVPPAEFEEAFYAAQRQAKVLAENTTLGSLQNSRRFTSN